VVDHIGSIPLQKIVQEVTKSLNEVNFFGFENRIRALILGLLEKPIQTMKDQESTIKLLSTSSKSYMRRIHEVEFIVHKFQHTVATLEDVELELARVKEEMKNKDLEYKTSLALMSETVENTFPNMIKDYNAEVAGCIMHTNKLEAAIETVTQVTG
jgi:hypothetical protein